MSLKDIMKDEFSTSIVCENPYYENIAEELGGEEEMSEELVGHLTEYEWHAFEQGFIRGIAAVKGGAL